MDPIFTIPYSEFCVAQKLSETFKKKDGYSVYVPLSRQEKGVDLILARRDKNENKLISIQVKASRFYPGTHGPKFDICFNTFKVPGNAEFIFLVAVYPDIEKSRKTSSAWLPLILVFSNKDMTKFIENVKTKKAGKPDSWFYFSFDDVAKIKRTRGNGAEDSNNYSDHLLSNKIEEIRKSLT